MDDSEPTPQRTAGQLLIEALARHGLTAQLEDTGDGTTGVVHRFVGGEAVFSNGQRADYPPHEHTGWYGFIDDRRDYREMNAPYNTDCVDDSAKTAAAYARYVALRDTAGQYLVDALYEQGIVDVALIERSSASALAIPHGAHRIVIDDDQRLRHAPSDHRGWRAVLVTTGEEVIAEVYTGTVRRCAEDSERCAAALAGWLRDHPAT